MPAAYHLPASISRDSLSFVATHNFVTHTMKVSDVRNLIVHPVPSLVDEIAFTMEDAIGNRVLVRETTPDFHWLAEYLGVNALLGSDWYSRAEAGEHLSAAVRR